MAKYCPNKYLFFLSRGRKQKISNIMKTIFACHDGMNEEQLMKLIGKEGKFPLFFSTLEAENRKYLTKWKQFLPVMMAWLKNNWWNWLAKEENKQPRARTRPPITPVNRVDFRLQTPTVNGERIRLIARHKPPNAPVDKKKYHH